MTGRAFFQKLFGKYLTITRLQDAAAEITGNGFPVISELLSVLKSSSSLPSLLASGPSKLCKPLPVLNSFLSEIPKVVSVFLTDLHGQL